MKPSWRWEIAQLAIIAGMFIAAAAAWSYLPERLPIHWNLRGEVDGWGNKFVGVLLMPLIALGMYALFVVLPLIDPGRINYPSFGKTYAILRTAFIAYIAVIFIAILLSDFGYKINMSNVILPMIGILFIVIGNFLGKIRPNWFVGVRTPWTLSSQLSWDKTHRLAGWLFMFMGALFFALALVPTGWALGIVLTIDALCLAWMIAYSYLVYRSDPHRVPPAGTSPQQ